MATDSNVTDGVADYTAAVLREKLNIFSDSIQSGFIIHCMQHTQYKLYKMAQCIQFMLSQF